MSYIRLERPVHYGNSGVVFNERRPPDDAYLFQFRDLKDIWGAVRSVTERYGYACSFGADGSLYLNPYNAPHATYDLPDGTGGGTLNTSPAAYGGTYLSYGSTVPAFTLDLSDTLMTARIDLVVGVGPGYGTWNYTVRDSSSTVVATGTVTTASEVESLVYDPRQTVEGGNPCVATLYSGYYGAYTLELSSTDPAPKRLDAIQLWHTDPLLPLAPLTLTTGQNALKVQSQSTMGDLRNYVIVVGRRKAVVTDSEKLPQNPNNPDAEFVVASGSDVASIAVPGSGAETTPNYLGFLKESIIFDPKITDQDYASYVAQAFLYRYRLPKPNVPVEHTFLPILELGDPIHALEETWGTVDQSQVLWVSGYTHQVQGGQATTTIETVSYPPYPSYQPREDLDLSVFKEQPVANISVSYVGLDGVELTNPGQAAATRPFVVGDGYVTMLVDATYDSGVLTLPGGSPWPPIPGTVQLRRSIGSTTVAGQTHMLIPDPSEIIYDQNGDPQGPEFLGLGVPANGVMGPFYLPGLEYSSPIVVKVNQFAYNAFEQTETPVGQWTLNTDPADSVNPFYYSIDASRNLRLYRIAATYPEEQLGFGYTWQIDVTWYRVQQGSSSPWVTNNPYQHLFNVDYTTPRLNMVWKQGDGTSGYSYNPAITTWDVRYRALTPDGVDPYAGASPFYDPYTSELGSLVTLAFDALVGGNYRITICDAATDLPVAWLTEPTLDATDPEQHWEALTPGRRSFSWDGVDQIGDWNRQQSQAYADAAHGAFHSDERPVVGSGYYAWNNEQRQGQVWPPQALLSMQLDGTGKPVFGHGTYGSWYLRIEVENDHLAEIAEGVNPNDAYAARKTARRTVVTKPGNPVTSMEPSINGGATAAMVYTYLGEPTRVKLTVADWRSNAPPYSVNSDVGEVTTYWQSTPTTDAVVSNTRPVRLRFTVLPRPGGQWVGLTDELSVKLTRRVHLRYTLFDQFTLNNGGLFPGTLAPDRRVVTRRLTNDDHTIDFEDEGYRKASEFRQAGDDFGTEWVFLPSDFKTDFGRGRPNEQLTFGDYLQLEEVPGWSSDGAIGGARSFLHLALVNYLFYLGAFSQDRSGRYSWAVNTDFVDQSKVVHNSAADWPGDPTGFGEDPDRHFRATWITRQWSDEAAWRQAQISQYAIPDFQQPLLQGKLTDMLGVGGGLSPYTQHHIDRGDLPANFVAGTLNSGIGNWTWEGWTPCIGQDFHGYYFLPPMVDARSFFDPSLKQAAVNGTAWWKNHIYASVDVRPIKFTDFSPKLPDTAALPLWQSVVEVASMGSGSRRFFPGSQVQVDADGKLVLQDDPMDSGTSEYDLTNDTTVMNYQRQDQLVHYEDLRGTFSRGPKPGEAPKKISSVGPYYVNPYTYGVIDTRWAVTSRDVKVTPYPIYRADVQGQTGWFEYRFRSEYLWESRHFFPTGQYGQLQSRYYNLDRSHLDAPAVRYFDSGAWCGWKDDSGSSGLGTNRDNVFDDDYAVLPVAAGPRIPGITQNMRFHLVLVNDRRSVPL